MFNLNHLKLLTSRAVLRPFLAIVVVLCMLVIMLPADLGALLVGAASNKWDGTLEAFENYSDSYSQFANGKTAYKIANAKQLAFLAAVLNATPTRSYLGPCKVTLDMNGDGTAETTYSFPGTGTLSKDATTILVGAKFELTEDIDLGGLQWSPIGTSSLPFRATFEGNGHTIKGLSYIDETTPNGSSSGIGLFGRTGSTAVINNLHVQGTIKTYQANMGGIVGCSSGALQMENCSFSGTVQGGGWAYLANTGGLIGHATSNSAVTIKNCFVHGEGTAITGVTASGDKEAASYSPEAVGGLVGYVGVACDMTITDSYADCVVTGVNGSGGLVGTIQSYSNLTSVLIERCYTAGSLVSSAYVGGLVGWVRDTLNETNATTKVDLTIKDSYSVMDLTNATNARASGLISCSRPAAAEPEDVTISLIGCHFAGLNAKQPVMYFDAAYSTLQTVERVYYRAGSTTSKTHTLQSCSGIEEKSRKAFMDGQVTELLNLDRDVWATSMWAEYPVLGQEVKPSLSELTVNGETIPLLDKVFEYTAANEVEDTVESVLVSATAAQEGATVTVEGVDANGYVTLGIPGTTSAITVTVTYNSVLTSTYTVNVYRKPTPWDGTYEVFENYESDPDTYDHYEDFINKTRVYEIANAKQLAFLMQLAATPDKAGFKETVMDLPSNKRLFKVFYDIDNNGENETYYFVGGKYVGFLNGVEFKLIADIDLGGVGENKRNWFTALSMTGTASDGTTATSTQPLSFKGTLNGDGHSVKNLYVKGSTNYVGLIPKLAYGIVKNLTVYGDVEGLSYTGGIAGSMEGGADITNCGFVGTVSGTTYIGGIAGQTVPYSGAATGCDFILTNCWTEGTLLAKGSTTATALSGVGGLMGHSAYNKSYDGSVTSGQAGDGGNLTLNNCYSTMTITPRSDAGTSMKNGLGVGGLVGQNSTAFGTSSYTVPGKVLYNNCYFAGSVKTNPFGTEQLVADGTSKVEVQNGLFYKAGSVTDATAAGVTGVKKSPEEFADGTVTDDLNNYLTTPVWVTSTAGYPVFSDLAETLYGALGVLGTSIRTEGVQALRFKFSVTDAAVESTKLQKVGVLAAKASKKIVGEHLYAHNLASNTDGYYKYIDAAAYTKGGNKLALIDDGSKFLFTAALYNLTEAKYGIDYIARAYAKFVDSKGQEIIVYGETIGDEYFNSVYDVVDGFFNYPSTYDISMSDLLVLKNIYDDLFAEEEVLPPDADIRSGGDNPQEGGADAEADALRDKILNAKDVDPQTFLDAGGTVYYISPSGNDANDGTSPETAWKNVDAINLHSDQIRSGDAVLFERGGIYRSVTSLLAEPIPEGVQSTSAQQVVYAQSGVTYGAYGEGAKPAIYSCHKNYAWGDPWRKSDKGENLWEVYTPCSDAGSIVFNHGEAAGIKRFGVWTGNYNTNGQKVFSGFITPENVGENLTENFEYYHDHRNGVLYLYLEGDKAPHDLYEDIEICPRDGVFYISNNVENVHIDNLAIKYTGFYGVSIKEYAKGTTVTNCEMGWIGGCQWRFNTEGEGSRIGNAIEFWETTTDARTENNWIYQVYDAGLSPQGVSSDGVSVYTNLVMRENLVEYCSYNIEWFDRNGSDVNKDHPSEWNGYYIEDNILRFAGYGFGRQRQDANQAPSNICGWTFKYDNPLHVYIRNNIFDCSEKNTVYWRWNDERTYAPDLVISGNTFYEKASESGNTLYYGPNGEQWKATDQATLEEAILTFDPNPKHVEWLTFENE